jgi:hypothetical protein
MRGAKIFGERSSLMPHAQEPSKGQKPRKQRGRKQRSKQNGQQSGKQEKKEAEMKG